MTESLPTASFSRVFLFDNSYKPNRNLGRKSRINLAVGLSCALVVSVIYWSQLQSLQVSLAALDEIAMEFQQLSAGIDDGSFDFLPNNDVKQQHVHIQKLLKQSESAIEEQLEDSSSSTVPLHRLKRDTADLDFPASRERVLNLGIGRKTEADTGVHHCIEEHETMEYKDDNVIQCWTTKQHSYNTQLYNVSVRARKQGEISVLSDGKYFISVQVLYTEVRSELPFLLFGVKGNDNWLMKCAVPPLHHGRNIRQGCSTFGVVYLRANDVISVQFHLFGTVLLDVSSRNTFMSIVKV